MAFRTKSKQSNESATPPRPPRSAAWGAGPSEGSTRSQQRPISSIGAPKIGGHQVSAWSKVTIATVFFFSISIGFISLFVFLSVVWLMPPWFGFFRMIQDGILVNQELFPRAVYGILSWSSIISIVGYVITQGYQSSESLEIFGIKLPKSAEIIELRWALYGAETIVVSQQAVNNAVGGFSGSLANNASQVWGLTSSNFIGFVFVLITIGAQVMISEVLIKLSAKSFKLAMDTMLLNAGVAAKQSQVGTAKPAAWGSDRSAQRPAQTVDVSPAPPRQSESRQQADREQDAGYSHGEFYQDQKGIWKYMETQDDGTSRSKVAKDGAAISFKGLNYSAKLNEGQWDWKVCETAPKAPPSEPRPQRRSANPPVQQPTAPHPQQEVKAQPEKPIDVEGPTNDARPPRVRRMPR